MDGEIPQYNHYQKNQQWIKNLVELAKLIIKAVKLMLVVNKVYNHQWTLEDIEEEDQEWIRVLLKVLPNLKVKELRLDKSKEEYLHNIQNYMEKTKRISEN